MLFETKKLFNRTLIANSNIFFFFSFFRNKIVRRWGGNYSLTCPVYGCEGNTVKKERSIKWHN